MHSAFDALIHIDWKLPGNELLALFQHYYPAVQVFQGARFEALLDQLSNEMPEVCFEVLAPLLAAEGYDLWNLDGGGDDYHLVVTPTAQRQAFIAHCQVDGDEPHFEPALIAPPPPPASKPEKKPGKRRKLNWLEEVHEYPAVTYVQAHNYRNGWAAISEQDDEQWLCFLIDYNTWPPTEQDMLEHRSDGVDGLDLQLIDATAEYSLWRRWVVSGDYSSDDRYVYERRQGSEIQRFGPAELQWPPFDDPCVVVGGQILERQEVWEAEQQLTRIWRITADTSEVIFESPGEMTLLPIGPNRVLFMQDHACQCWIWHSDQPHPPLPAKPLPAAGDRLRAATAYLGGDEILLFSDSQRQNLEDPIYPETVLLAWRFNVLTGAASKALLDGFGSELRQQTSLLANQPKRTITLRTFHGQLDVARGHGDWWLWSHSSNTFGTHTLAWWWNQQTHQVLQLTTRDIPRIKPYICYVPAQDRYLALADELAARLPAFETMIEAKGVEVLVFE